MRERRCRILLLMVAPALPAPGAGPARLEVHPERRFQAMDGFGVKFNGTYFRESQKRLIDLLMNDLGVTLFRLNPYGPSDWEAKNDDPRVLNWNYYSDRYSIPALEASWAACRHLNSKGIQPFLTLSGTAPLWMLEPPKRNATPGASAREREKAEGPGPLRLDMFEELAETASLAIYARRKTDVDFQYFSPVNETEGPGASPSDLPSLAKAIARRLQEAGMSDVKLVLADQCNANTNNTYDYSDTEIDYSDTEINADPLAFYVLEHNEWDPYWRRLAKSALHWSFNILANREHLKWGVVAINAQTVYRVPGNSHSSRHASVELTYCEKTGDYTLEDDAIRRLNWATHTVDDDGKPVYSRRQLADGRIWYGDYVRKYLRTMAAAPELAPEDQNHLLRGTSVVRSIEYGPAQIRHDKFDRASREEFKMSAWTPGSVRGGTMKWDAQRKLPTISANSDTVTILK